MNTGPELITAKPGRIGSPVRRGSLCALTVRGSREEIEGTMDKISPIFYEMLPLSLEEIFISETEVKGYDIKSLIL